MLSGYLLVSILIFTQTHECVQWQPSTDPDKKNEYDDERVQMWVYALTRSTNEYCAHDYMLSRVVLVSNT